MYKIITNKIKCNYCGDIIESTYRHDMRWCKCGKVAVDGGHEYLRRCFPGDVLTEDAFEDLSEVEELEEVEEVTV